MGMKKNTLATGKSKNKIKRKREESERCDEGNN
jgi:hypothetical protein